MGLDEIPAPCWVSDGQGRVLSYNQRLAEWAGLAAPGDEGAGELQFSQWLTAAGRIFFETHVWPTLRRDGGVTEVFAHWQPQGRRLGAYVSAQALGSPPWGHYVWLLFGAQERQDFEQALIDARRRAQEQAEQLRDAHERLRLLNEQLQQQIHLTQADNQALSVLAVHDELTGLGNRRSLQSVARTVAARPLPRRPFAVLMLDIDHFKAVNDRHGHDRGDAVLVDVARCLQRNARQSDAAIRYGGEEFVMVLLDADLAQAKAVAERLREDVFRTQPGQLPVTVSVGVAAALGPNDDLYEVLKRADDALYRAKAAGRNAVACA